MNPGRTRWLCASRNHNLLGVKLHSALRSINGKSGGAFETRYTSKNFYPVPGELSLRNVNLSLNNVLYPEGKISHRDLFFNSITYAINVLVIVAGQMQDSLPHRLTRDGSSIDTSPADNLPSLN